MMSKKQERVYLTNFSEETITMDKYNELLKDIAVLIADAHRENFLLNCELEETRKMLDIAEKKLEEGKAHA